ncbi:hypothetical protein QYF61_011638, partial [Mycteria americana]
MSSGHGIVQYPSVTGSFINFHSLTVLLSCTLIAVKMITMRAKLLGDEPSENSLDRDTSRWVKNWIIRLRGWGLMVHTHPDGWLQGELLPGPSWDLSCSIALSIACGGDRSHPYQVHRQAALLEVRAYIQRDLDRLEDGWLGNSSAEDPGVLGNSMLNADEQYALVARESGSILGCSTMPVAAGQLCVVWGSPGQEKLDKLERVQWRATRMGWRLNHFPGQSVPMLDNPLGEEKFPNIQSKPPLAQLEAISSCPITCYLGEETDPHLSTTSFQ